MIKLDNKERPQDVPECNHGRRCHIPEPSTTTIAIATAVFDTASLAYYLTTTGAVTAIKGPIKGGLCLNCFGPSQKITKADTDVLIRIDKTHPW